MAVVESFSPFGAWEPSASLWRDVERHQLEEDYAELHRECEAVLEHRHRLGRSPATRDLRRLAEKGCRAAHLGRLESSQLAELYDALDRLKAEVGVGELAERMARAWPSERARSQSPKRKRVREDD